MCDDDDDDDNDHHVDNNEYGNDGHKTTLHLIVL